MADPDPIVTRAGTIQRPERSHQLDVGGATGMGSLRLQDAYRVDPNDLRSLATGVAYVVTGGRAAKVAVAAARVTTPAALTRRKAPNSNPAPESDDVVAPPEDGDPVAGCEPEDQCGEQASEESRDPESAGITSAAFPYGQGL